MNIGLYGCNVIRQGVLQHPTNHVFYFIPAVINHTLYDVDATDVGLFAL